MNNQTEYVSYQIFDGSTPISIPSILLDLYEKHVNKAFNSDTAEYFAVTGGFKKGDSSIDVEQAVVFGIADEVNTYLHSEQIANMAIKKGLIV